MFYQYGPQKLPFQTKMTGIGYEMLEGDNSDEEQPLVKDNTCYIDRQTSFPVTEHEFKILALLMNANPFHINAKMHGDKKYGLHDFEMILKQNYPTNAFQNWHSRTNFALAMLGIQ